MTTLVDAPPSDNRPTILVVDDDRDSADSLAILLRLMGHDVATAYDGPRTLEAARTLRPGVILLDIGLPGMDGYAVARTLIDELGRNGVVLIAVTGYGREDDKRRAREAG